MPSAVAGLRGLPSYGQIEPDRKRTLALKRFIVTGSWPCSKGVGYYSLRRRVVALAVLVVLLAPNV